MIDPNDEVEFLAFKEFLKQCTEFVDNYEKMKKMYPTISKVDITFFVSLPKLGTICEILNMSGEAMVELQKDIIKGAPHADEAPSSRS